MLRERQITLWATPKGVDVVIQDLQLALNDLSWLTKSFGKAVKYVETRGDNEEYTLFKTYFKNREWTNLDPDDTVKAYSFIYEDSPSAVELGWVTTTLNLVVFANLNLFTDEEDNIFLEDLASETLKLIQDHYAKDPKFNSVNFVYKGIEDSFSEVDASTQIKWMSENYATFRISLEVNYQYDLCVTQDLQGLDYNLDLILN